MKNIIFIKIIFILLAVSISNRINAQHYCGQDKLTQQLRQFSPAFDEELTNLYKAWEDNTKQNARIEGILDSVYTVQVVVHIVYLEDNPEQNIPDAIIQSQIDALNRDFGVLNADTVNLRPIFKPFRGYPKIKFELAKLDTLGNPTSGIVRVAGIPPTNKPIITNPLDSILNELMNVVGDWFKKGYTISTLPGNVQDTTMGSQIWDNKRYLNIWVTNLNRSQVLGDGLLGGFAFAPPGLKNWPFGIGYPADNMDGVSIDYRFFGENNFFVQNNPQYLDVLSKGRTTVHEVSHYLGLRHIWGDYGNVFNAKCSQSTHNLLFSDGMDDTPPCQSPFATTVGGYNCDTTVNTCTIPYKGVDYPDLFENYMDYSGDECYNMFTKNQADFMRFVLTTKRGGIISKREVEMLNGIKIQKNHQNQFVVFPNPAQNYIQLQSKQPLEMDTKVELIDVSGRKINEFTFYQSDNNLNINTSQLVPATYFLRISNSKWITTENFIKF